MIFSRNFLIVFFSFGLNCGQSLAATMESDEELSDAATKVTTSIIPSIDAGTEQSQSPAMESSAQTPFIPDSDDDIYVEPYAESSVKDYFEGDPIFTSDYTQDFQPSEQRSVSNNVQQNFLQDAIDPEVKNEIKSFIKEVKDTAKLKAYELGFMDDELQGNEAVDITKRIEQDQRTLENLNRTSYAQNTNWDNHYKAPKKSQLESVNDEDSAKEFYRKIKIGAITLFSLYLLYKLFCFLRTCGS